MTATPTSPAASQQAAVDAALLILEWLGPVPRRPDRQPREAGARADLRRVRAGGVRRGHRRDPQGPRLLLEPGRRAVGRPAPGRADALGDPATGRVRQVARGATPQRPRRPRRRREPDRRAALPLQARRARAAARPDRLSKATRLQRPRPSPDLAGRSAWTRILVTGSWDYPAGNSR
jgi:hypothetical protein